MTGSGSYGIVLGEPARRKRSPDASLTVRYPGGRCPPVVGQPGVETGPEEDELRCEDDVAEPVRLAMSLAVPRPSCAATLPVVSTTQPKRVLGPEESAWRLS